MEAQTYFNNLNKVFDDLAAEGASSDTVSTTIKEVFDMAVDASGAEVTEVLEETADYTITWLQIIYKGYPLRTVKSE